MELRFDNSKEPLSDNVATLEHLDDKFNDKRGTFHHVKRVVLACNKCNHEKGKKNMMDQGIEELRRRAKSGKR